MAIDIMEIDGSEIAETTGLAANHAIAKNVFKIEPQRLL